MNYTLFILLLLCHFAGDFTHLSRPYMLAAKATGKDVYPIFQHGCVHAALMGLVMLFFVAPGLAFALMVFQAIVHTAIDVAKGRLQGRYEIFRSASSYWHWYLFGADQVLHILVILLMIKLCTLT